ncbi:MAG: beta-lactamase family protein, partial [Deltaproteobacteria bacterium]|nr:beta-lactamase family protein [Deltaproteobacteria bacterium]
MAPASKRILLGIAGLLVLLLVFTSAIFVWTIAPLGTRYIAKRMCSGVFVAERAPESVWKSELRSGSFGYPPSFGYEIDEANKRVTASWNGMAVSTVAFRPALGCTPVPEGEKLAAAPGSEHRVGYAEPFAFPPRIAASPALAPALDWAFSDPKLRTRAVLVVHRGRLVAERYAKGFDQDTPQMGWSMTKSVGNALIGTLVEAGSLRLDQDHLFPEWEDTERAAITVEQLLQMSSGLAWDESYDNPYGDALQMLFGSDDAARVALGKELRYPPGEVFEYSSGTSNLLGLLLKRTLMAATIEPLHYPQRALFGPLGMRTAVLEPDPRGTLVLSSFSYASGRDWARFGLLYLNDGVAGDRRILPEGWAARACAPAAADASYGEHFWRDVSREGDPDLPSDTCHAAGHDGQYVTIVRSRELVVVRLGLT